MSKYQVPAVVGAVKILNELGGLGDAGATQSQLVGTTGLSKSTLHNLLSTLESSGFVRKDPDSRIYHLGPALIPLGSAASRQAARSATGRLDQDLRAARAFSTIAATSPGSVSSISPRTSVSSGFLT